MKIFKFDESNGERFYIAADKIIGFGPVGPMIGRAAMYVLGLPGPIQVDGTPEELAAFVAEGDVASRPAASSLVST